MTTTETPQLETPQAMMDFFAHLGLPLPEELSEQSLADTNTILAHFGIDDSEVVAIGPDGNPITGAYREDYGTKGSAQATGHKWPFFQFVVLDFVN